jgi:hypothetical protein
VIEVALQVRTPGGLGGAAGGDFACALMAQTSSALFTVRLCMKKTDHFFPLLQNGGLSATARRIASAAGLGTMLFAPVVDLAQNPTPAEPFPAAATHVTVPDGYSLHQAVDLGGRISTVSGSPAMYDTLVNLHSGPRVLGETFELHVLPGSKSTLVDTLSAFSSGFGGDPDNVARLNASKGRLYDFSGLFRRDRQYFDYDLLGNPNVPPGQSIPIGPLNAPTGHFSWPLVEQSPVLFNTVRRMTDTSLTLLPLSKVSYRFGYSQNVFEGPSLSPGVSSNFFAESIGATDQLLEQYLRNSTDEFLGAIDWKPVSATTLTFEEVVNHYKGDSYFSLWPGTFLVQEADGTPVSLGGWDSLTPYSAFNCNANSMGASGLLSAAQTPGGKLVVNAACAVASSYLRSQPTRILFPTEMFRFQSSSFRNVSMNGAARYTQANMNLPHYYEDFEGLDGTARSITYTGFGSGKRQVIAIDYGLVWRATPTLDLAEQVNFSNMHQPGTDYTSLGATLNTPATAGNETINYTGPLAPGAPGHVEGSPNGASLPDFFGLRDVTNNLTASWMALPRATFSLSYRYRTHTIAEGIPHNTPLLTGATSNGTVAIDENGGVLGVALRPAADWSINGSAEALYADNALTPLGARQTRHYRVHTRFRPRPWATISGAYNDLERHNNTNNNQSAVAAGDATYDGPLGHEDHSRFASLGASLQPNEHYGFDFTYSYSDVYISTNACYNAAAGSTLPGAATPSGAACPGATVLFTNYYEFGPVKDFMDAPTQSGSAALTFAPFKALRSSLGERVSAVNGSQFFNDARAVNGSLDSTFQNPFVRVALTVHHGWIWSAEYNFSGYGEGGRSGAEYCSTSNPTPGSPAPVVPCSSLPFATGLTESPAGLSAPRNFHANNVTVGMHYEF